MPSNCLAAINVAITFNMGTDLESILSSPIGQPLATVSNITVEIGVKLKIYNIQIFFNSFGQKGTLVLWSFIIIVQCAKLMIFLCVIWAEHLLLGS